MSNLAKVRAGYRRLRERIYEAMEVAMPGDVLSRVLNLGITALVLISIAAFALGFVARLASYRAYLDLVETVSVALFTAEYLLRLWSCVASARHTRPLIGRLRFAMRPMMLIDLLAVLPYYLPF